MSNLESASAKDVRDRTEIDHLIIIKEKFNGSVRDYLLDLGVFNE